jgi:hypothetical protein
MRTMVMVLVEDITTIDEDEANFSWDRMSNS